MKKKTYKRMQNRLYREIKRRQLAESYIRKPVNFTASQEKVETLKVAHVLNRYEFEGIDYSILSENIKKEMLRQLENKLLEENYILFVSHQETSLQDVLYTEAWLKVVKPNFY